MLARRLSLFLSQISVQCRQSAILFYQFCQLSVRLMPVLCLNELTSSHFVDVLVGVSFSSHTAVKEFQWNPNGGVNNAGVGRISIIVAGDVQVGHGSVHPVQSARWRPRCVCRRWHDDEVSHQSCTVVMLLRIETDQINHAVSAITRAKHSRHCSGPQQVRLLQCCLRWSSSL